jgi:hypothetical protein
MKLFILLDIDDCIIHSALFNKIEPKMFTLPQYFSNLESIGQDIVEENRALIKYVRDYVRKVSIEQNVSIDTVELVSFSNRQTRRYDLESGFKLKQGGASYHIFTVLKQALSKILRDVNVTFNEMLLEDFYPNRAENSTSKEIKKILETYCPSEETYCSPEEKDSFLNPLEERNRKERSRFLTYVDSLNLPHYGLYASRAYRSKLLLACLLMHCLYGNNKSEPARFLFMDDKYIDDKHKEAANLKSLKENMLGCLSQLFKDDPSLIPTGCVTDFVHYANGTTPKDIATVTGTGKFNKYYANLTQLGSGFLKETFDFSDDISDGKLFTHFLSEWKSQDSEGRLLGSIFIEKCRELSEQKTLEDNSQGFFEKDKEKDNAGENIDASNPSVLGRR